MSERDAEFERRARRLLQGSVRDLDAATRSKLAQARHAALDTRRGLRARAWWSRGWMVPTGASFAAVLVAMVVINQHRVSGEGGVNGNGADDLELLADVDGLELADMPDYDFYEWAVAQAAEDGHAPAGT